MTKIKTVLIWIMLIMAGQAHAHGENKLGPNGGYIQMPGAFHTELVPMGTPTFKVYLLDMSWKNPSVLHSKITMTFKSDTIAVANCVAEPHFYICKFELSVDLEANGQIVIEAVRQNQRGKAVMYSLPLKIRDTNEHTQHKM